MVIIDERTPNLGLPLPYRDNDMADDVERIRQSFFGLDTAVGEVRLTTAEAVKEAGVARDAASSAAQGTDRALADVAKALDTAGAAVTAAAKAADTADNALELARDTLETTSRETQEARSEAAQAQNTGAAAVALIQAMIPRLSTLFGVASRRLREAGAAYGRMMEDQAVRLDSFSARVDELIVRVEEAGTPGDIASGKVVPLVFDVPGATVDQVAVVSPPEAVGLLQLSAWAVVTGADTVTVFLYNPSAATVRPASGVYRIAVL